MTGTIRADRERMARSMKAMGQARTALNGFVAEASSIHAPAEPAALRARIDHALADAARTARRSEQQLARLQRDLVRRDFLFALADAVGSGVLLRGAATADRTPGSGKLTPDGLLPGFFGSDRGGALLGGVGEALERYSKIYNVRIRHLIEVERSIQRRFKVVTVNGRQRILSITEEMSRVRITREVRVTAVKWAGAARNASKVLGPLGKIDDAVTIYNGVFRPKGPHKTAQAGGAIGKVAGSMAMAEAGATAGATIGLALGGPIGAAVGGGIGALGGAFIGSKVGKRTGELIGEGAAKAVDGAKKAAGAAKHALGDAKHALGKLF